MRHIHSINVPTYMLIEFPDNILYSLEDVFFKLGLSVRQRKYFLQPECLYLISVRQFGGTYKSHVPIQRGIGGPPLPGKSQVLWVL